MKRSIFVLTMYILLAAWLAPPAFAETGGQFTETESTDTGASVGVSQGVPGDAGAGRDGGSPGPSAPKVSPYSGCAREDFILSSFIHGLQENSELFSSLKDPVTDSSLAWARCTRKDDGSLDQFLTGLNLAPPAPAPAPGPPAVDVLVAAARSQLTIALPEVATAPPQGGLQLVGVDVWFWVTNNAPVSATAEIPALAATVTAEPTATKVRFADGTSLDCAGAGTPYDPKRSYESQTSDCTHVFDDTGPQPVDITVEWSLTWNASNGQNGALAPLPRTTTITLPLQQAQAVTD